MIDINKIWVSNELFSAKTRFKYISFLIKDDELSKNAMKLEKMLKVISKKKN